MFTKILVISELHYNFTQIRRCLQHLQKLGTSECLLIQCLNPHELSEAVASLIVEVYKKHLAEQQKELEQMGFKVQARQMVGVFRDNINQMALEENCSLIIAGAAERTVIGSMLDGGAAYHMMQKSAVPLLIVRTPSDPTQKDLALPDCHLIDHLLFPTDFSENAARAFAVVKEAARFAIKKITLLHVQDKSRIEPHLLGQLDNFNVKDDQRLKDMARELKEAGSKAEIDLRLIYGSPTAEILNFIGEEKVSWVIMGSQGRGWIKEIYLGNVSHNIARHAPVPVLLVPAQQEN